VTQERTAAGAGSSTPHADGRVIFCGGGKLAITDLAITSVTVKDRPVREIFCAFGYTPL
jgi:hypothetical protein